MPPFLPHNKIYNQFNSFTNLPWQRQGSWRTSRFPSILNSLKRVKLLFTSFFPKLPSSILSSRLHFCIRKSHDSLTRLPPKYFLPQPNLTQYNTVIWEASSHSSQCPHILHIMQHILLHQHQIYHALYLHYLGILSRFRTYANLYAQSMCYIHTHTHTGPFQPRTNILLPLSFSPDHQKHHYSSSHPISNLSIHIS